MTSLVLVWSYLFVRRFTSMSVCGLSWYRFFFCNGACVQWTYLCLFLRWQWGRWGLDHRSCVLSLPSGEGKGVGSRRKVSRENVANLAWTVVTASVRIATVNQNGTRMLAVSEITSKIPCSFLVPRDWSPPPFYNAALRTLSEVFPLFYGTFFHHVPLLCKKYPGNFIVLVM